MFDSGKDPGHQRPECDARVDRHYTPCECRPRVSRRRERTAVFRELTASPPTRRSRPAAGYTGVVTGVETRWRTFNCGCRAPGDSGGCGNRLLTRCGRVEVEPNAHLLNAGLPHCAAGADTARPRGGEAAKWQGREADPKHPPSRCAHMRSATTLQGVRPHPRRRGRPVRIIPPQDGRSAGQNDLNG